jgi:hypothetical protein
MCNVWTYHEQKKNLVSSQFTQKHFQVSGTVQHWDFIQGFQVLHLLGLSTWDLIKTKNWLDWIAHITLSRLDCYFIQFFSVKSNTDWIVATCANQFFQFTTICSDFIKVCTFQFTCEHWQCGHFWAWWMCCQVIQVKLIRFRSAWKLIPHCAGQMFSRSSQVVLLCNLQQLMNEACIACIRMNLMTWCVPSFFSSAHDKNLYKNLFSGYNSHNSIDDSVCYYKDVQVIHVQVQNLLGNHTIFNKHFQNLRTISSAKQRTIYQV